MSEVFDAVGPLERIKISAELAGKVKDLAQVAGPLQRVKVAQQVAELLRKLGAGVKPPEAEGAGSSQDFPLKEAASSYSGISHSGTTRARGDAEAYEKAIADAVAEAEPFVETDAQRTVLASEEAAYRVEYLAQYRQLMVVRSGTYSGHVAGRSNLNSKQASARNSALDRAMSRFYGWVESQGSRIKHAVQRARSPDQLAAAQAVKDAEQAAKDAKRAETQRKNVDFMVKLLTFKAGDELALGGSVIKKVSKDREGNPSKLTYVLTDGTTPFDDKIDVLRVLYRGDKEALRRDADAARVLISGASAVAQPSMPSHWSEKLLAGAEPGDIVLPEQVQARLDAHEGMFESAPLRGEASEEDIQDKAKSITAANFSSENKHAAKLQSTDQHALEMRKAVDLLALSRTLVAIGTRKNAQAPDGFTQVGTPYFQAAERYKNGAMAALASARGIAAFLAAMERHLAKPKRPSTASFDKHLVQNVTPPRLDLPTVEYEGDTWYILSTGTRREDGKVFAHLSSTTRGRQAANGVHPYQANDYIDLPEAGETEQEGEATVEHEIVEHVTKGGKGKTIRGIIRTDLTYAEAKAIDEYTFKKDGGWFIREKHLDGYIAPEGGNRPAPTPKPELSPEELAQAEADRLANEQVIQQQKRAQQAAKLREVAASTLEKAEASINQDRNTNTARRARMASSALGAAEADRALALTINNLADAIESGQATHLAGITSRAAVQSLQDSLRNAMYEAERGLSYADQQRQKGRAPTLADVEHAKIHMPKWGTAGSSVAGVLEAIKGKKGSVELAQKIRYSAGPDAEMISALKAMIGEKETSYQIGWWNLEQVAKVARLKRAGISNDRELKDALAEYLQFREGARAEDPIKKAERAIIGQKVGIDFFPTPAATAARMAALARITKGDRVLEPSAGNGNLADAAKSAGGEVDVIEISSQLREILTAKGYNVVAHDFDNFEPEEKYDAILMNPPFSSRQDAAHIMRAYRMVKAGGHLVAIAGEGVFFGSDGKAVQFRDWLDSVGAEVEGLDQGTFKDKSLLATTGANARLITIKK